MAPQALIKKSGADSVITASPEKKADAWPMPVRPMEAILVLGIFLGVVAGQLMSAGKLFILKRNFWVDELHTFWIVADPSLTHAMTVLKDGGDGGPPGLHLMLRAFTVLTGGPGEVSFRLFAFLCILTALAGLYSLLRAAGFSTLIALAAVLGVWCHPLVLFHAFEARFYSPWVAGAVWFCYGLARAHANGRRWWTNLLLAVSGVVMCTAHYFGIFTLALAVGADWCFNRNAGKLPWTTWAAMAAGPLALVACIPFFLGQRAALTISTWMEPWTWEKFMWFLQSVFWTDYLAVVLLVSWVSLLLSGGRTKPEAASPPLQYRFLSGLTGLVLLPALMIGFTLALQPAYQPRYGLPAVMVFGPAIALSIRRVLPPLAIALALVFVLQGAMFLRSEVFGYWRQDQKTEQLFDAIRTETGKAPVYFESYEEFWLVQRYAPDLVGRSYFLDFEGAETGKVIQAEIGNVNRARIMMRDYAQAHAKSFHENTIVPWKDLKKRHRIFLVPGYFTDDRANVSLNGDAYPGFRLQKLDEGLYELFAAHR